MQRVLLKLNALGIETERYLYSEENDSAFVTKTCEGGCIAYVYDPRSGRGNAIQPFYENKTYVLIDGILYPSDTTSQVVKKTYLDKNDSLFIEKSLLGWTLEQSEQQGEHHVFDASQQSATYFTVRCSKRSEIGLQSDELAWDASNLSVRFTKDEFEVFVAVLGIYVSGLAFYRQQTRNAILLSQTMLDLVEITFPNYDILLADVPHRMSDYHQKRWERWEWEHDVFA